MCLVETLVRGLPVVESLATRWWCAAGSGGSGASVLAAGRPRELEGAAVWLLCGRSCSGTPPAEGDGGGSRGSGGTGGGPSFLVVLRAGELTATAGTLCRRKSGIS